MRSPRRDGMAIGSAVSAPASADHGTGPNLAPHRRHWPDAIARRRYADPARQLVMGRIGDLVRDGAAEWRPLGNDDVELRFASGEVFLLSERTVTRIA